MSHSHVWHTYVSYNVTRLVYMCDTVTPRILCDTHLSCSYVWHTHVALTCVTHTCPKRLGPALFPRSIQQIIFWYQGILSCCSFFFDFFLFTTSQVSWFHSQVIVTSWSLCNDVCFDCSRVGSQSCFYHLVMFIFLVRNITRRRHGLVTRYMTRFKNVLPQRL